MLVQASTRTASLDDDDTMHANCSMTLFLANCCRDSSLSASAARRAAVSEAAFHARQLAPASRASIACAWSSLLKGTCMAAATQSARSGLARTSALYFI